MKWLPEFVQHGSDSVTGGRKYGVRNGLSHDSRYSGVLHFSAVAMKSALQMWAPNCRAATTIAPNPARDGTSLMLIAAVTVALAEYTS